MRPSPRLIAAAVLTAASVSSALGLGGCASFSRVIAPRPVCENPLIIPSADFETIWTETVGVVDEYFDIRSENRLARSIVTDPVLGATLLEPWRGDSVGFNERLESSLQTIRRFARVQIDPVPGRGFAVKVEVLKELEDLPKPDRQSAGRAVFNNDFPVNRTREIVGPVPIPQQWIPRGRDTALEQAILNKIKDALFL
ncbi:MAG: hypothetical protein U0835_03790 [Isosphaeraceae bacterium]